MTVEELFTCVFQILPLGFPLRLLPAVVELELLELVVFLNSLQVLQEVAELGLEVGQLGLGTEIVKVLGPEVGELPDDVLGHDNGILEQLFY